MRCSAADAAADRGQHLAEAMRYAVLGGGKRLRPFLLMQSAKLFGVSRGGLARCRLRARMRALLLAGA